MATLLDTTVSKFDITVESLSSNVLSSQGKDSFAQQHTTKFKDGQGSDDVAQAKVPWGIRKTIAGGATVDINVQTLDGARDADGTAISLDRIAVIACLGTAGQNGDGHFLFGGGGTAAFSGPFNDDKDAKLKMKGGGKIVLEDNSATGFVVDSDENIFRVQNTGTASKVLDIFVLGS